MHQNLNFHSYHITKYVNRKFFNSFNKKNLSETHDIYFVAMRYFRFVFTSFLIINFDYGRKTPRLRSPLFFVINYLSLNPNLIHKFEWHTRQYTFLKNFIFRNKLFFGETNQNRLLNEYLISFSWIFNMFYRDILSKIYIFESYLSNTIPIRNHIFIMLYNNYG